MYNGFRVTDGVNRALNFAGTIALTYGNFQIGTEHLLFGISSVKDSVASKILSSYGIQSEGVENVFSKTSSKKVTAILNSKIDLTTKTKEIFLIANQFANQIGHNFIGIEHLLVSLLSCDDSYGVTIIKKNFKVNINELKASVLQVLKAESLASGKTNNNSNMGNNREVGYSTRGESSQDIPKKLLEMGQDLTAKARMGKIDLIIGREEEIARIVEILCRKTKNNPILIGEPGVGKSAVADGLALDIVSGNVPDLLKNKIIFSLELGSLMAGTKYRGALEEKLKELISIITTNENIIVFIDEIHTLTQAGGEKGEINPADMLKPYLARGEFQTIGATTTDEFRRFIEKDKALERRFQPIIINPPSVEDTIKILQGLKSGFENFHKVTITDDAISASAILSDRYIMDRNLPDKAIDLIDEASSRAKIQGSRKPEELSKMEEEIEILEAQKRQALVEEDFEKATLFRTKLGEAQDKKREFLSLLQANDNQRIITITEEDISRIISDWTGIPITKITEGEKERLLRMEAILHKRVVGQEEAISAVSKAVRRARIGLKDSKRPIGSFMFLGQTGVGKTELCKALAEAMFDNENAVIRLDMSEYMEKHSISKLIGSPPGYIGYDDGGQLTEQVRRKPYSIVLFDEIEKAHPDVYNLLLQVLDDGRLTDSQGRLVNFKNTIIIFTSNVGANLLPKKSAMTELGFNLADYQDTIVDYELIRETLINAFKRSFKPEFINRIDVVTVFHPLNFEQLAQIAKIFISNLNKRLREKGLGMKVTESALKYIIEKGYDSEYGARPLRRLIEQEVEDRIAEDILMGKLVAGNIIIISAKEGVLNFKVQE